MNELCSLAEKLETFEATFTKSVWHKQLDEPNLWRKNKQRRWITVTEDGLTTPIMLRIQTSYKKSPENEDGKVERSVLIPAHLFFSL